MPKTRPPQFSWLFQRQFKHDDAEQDEPLRRRRCPDVHSRAQDKYRLVALYDALFLTGMKNLWNERVYVDLYAGAGIRRIEKGSPLIALTGPDRFDKYIFCKEDELSIKALKARVQRIAPQANVEYVLGSCDTKIDEICNHFAPESGAPLNRKSTLGRFPRKPVPAHSVNQSSPLQPQACRGAECATHHPIALAQSFQDVCSLRLL